VVKVAFLPESQSVDINNDGLKDIYILKSGRFETRHLNHYANELLINTGN